MKLFRSDKEKEAAGSSRADWPALVIALIGVGALARVVLLAFSWNDPLDPDSREYLVLARRYSFAHPWSASFREPLWRAIEKLATGPFGYSPHAQRVFTVAVSTAVLPVAWVLFRRLVRSRGLPDRVAIIALAVVALSAQTIREAPRGLREDTCMLIFLIFAVLLLSRPTTLRQAALMAAPVAVLSVIRWELATFAAFIAVVFALGRRATWLAPALAIAGIVVLSGPWLLANEHRHGSLSYNTKVHATYYWKAEQPKAVRARYQSPIGADPPVHLTWTQYYFDYLGPAKSAKRFTVGYVKVATKLLASQVVPRGAAASTLGNNQQGRGWKIALLAVGLVILALALLMIRRLRRTRPLPQLLWECLLIVVLAIAPYAALANVGLEIRVLLFSVPLLALAAAVIANALFSSEARRGTAQAVVRQPQ